eukprot:SAG31_NODE_33123_length_347_cov_1.237903_1_plen_42_part_10
MDRDSARPPGGQLDSAPALRKQHPAGAARPLPPRPRPGGGTE